MKNENLTVLFILIALSINSYGSEPYESEFKDYIFTKYIDEVRKNKSNTKKSFELVSYLILTLELSDGAEFNSISIDFFKLYKDYHTEFQLWFSKGNKEDTIISAIDIGCYESRNYFKKDELISYIEEIIHLEKKTKNYLSQKFIKSLIQCKESL